MLDARSWFLYLLDFSITDQFIEGLGIVFYPDSAIPHQIATPSTVDARSSLSYLRYGLP